MLAHALHGAAAPVPEGALGGHDQRPQRDRRRQVAQELLGGALAQRRVEPDQQRVIDAKRPDPLHHDRRRRQARHAGARVDHLVGVRIEDQRHGRRAELRRGRHRRAQQGLMSAMDAVEDAHAHRRRPDRRQAAQVRGAALDRGHAAPVVASTFSGWSCPAVTEPTPSSWSALSSTTRRPSVPPASLAPASDDARAVAEALRIGVGEVHPRQRQEVGHRQHGLGQPAGIAQRLELLGRHRVLHAEPGRLGAPQGQQVPATAQRLPQVARDRADVGARSAMQVDGDVHPAVATRDGPQVEGMDRDLPRGEHQCLAGARGPVCGAPAQLASGKGRRQLIEAAHEGRECRRDRLVVGERRRHRGRSVLRHHRSRRWRPAGSPRRSAWSRRSAPR